MCRLAFIPGKAKINYKQMTELFDRLQDSCGGDGNGYVAVSSEGQIISNKAVKLTNAQIVKQTYKLLRNGWNIYYHTRKVSVGWLDDSQCHPFEIRGKQFRGWLCHNGTWHDGSVMAKYFQVGSDTAALAKLIGQFGLKRLGEMKLFPTSGVFLLYGSHPSKQPMHRVLYLGGDLEYCPITGIWASELGQEWPHWNDTYYVATGRHMLEKPAPRKHVSTYQSGSKCYNPPHVRNYASDNSEWFRQAYGYDKHDDIEGLDYTVVDRNLLN